MAEKILAVLFTGCLIHAAVEDAKYMRVKRWIWWLAFFWGVLTCIFCRKTPEIPLFDLICFSVLQFGLFSQMYGLADCFAFVCCSIMLAANGGTIREYLMHMLCSVVLLGIVQLGRRNVTAGGRLKKEVAFIPYITHTFYLMLIMK